jgi:dihydrodipicolinate synthase/N-acetylneuraminate lyase
MNTVTEALARIKPNRKIEGISAVLLPFDGEGNIDYDSYARLLNDTVAAGLVPSVNMDTGYVNLLNQEQRRAVLAVAQDVLAGRYYVAGAFVEGESGDPLSLYLREVEAIQAHGGTPIMFQCSAMQTMAAAEVVALYRAVAERSGRLLAFELGKMFAPFGQIFPIEIVRELMQIPQLAGIKHSSLDRAQEWQRLSLRDELRPDFKIYTGNDLGIDMVMYGSDYLLGLSAFAPAAFALRDKMWAEGDSGFYTLNDVLQYLGTFGFRPPVPAYKHSAAQFLHLRGRIACSAPHPAGGRRPESDLPILQDIAERLERWGV